MNFLIKLVLSNIVIITCVLIAKKFSSLAGLIATMPLTSLIVMIWIYFGKTSDNELMVKYTGGAFWGTLPSILFFLVAFLCFRKQMAFPMVLSLSFGVWMLGAIVHQWCLR